MDRHQITAKAKALLSEMRKLRDEVEVSALACGENAYLSGMAVAHIRSACDLMLVASEYVGSVMGRPVTESDRAVAADGRA